jgi:hypothetical protein
MESACCSGGWAGMGGGWEGRRTVRIGEDNPDAGWMRYARGR